MKLVFLILVGLVSCGAPQAKVDHSEPLVSEKPIEAPLVIGNRGVALLRDGVVYLGWVDIPLGPEVEILEDFNGSVSNTIGAAHGRRALAAEEVPEKYRPLIGATIYSYDGTPCVVEVESMSVELFTKLPDVGFDDVETAVENITPTLLVAHLSQDSSCYPSMGVASLKPVAPDTFYDQFSYDEEDKIIKLMNTNRSAVLVDPIGPDDVIVSVEEMEDDCSKWEEFSLQVFRFRKNNGVWIKQELFEVKDSDGILYISNGNDGLIIGTETGVYSKGAFESYMPSRILPIPPDPNCKAQAYPK